MSAYSVMSRTGLSAVTAIVRTGAASGSRFSTIGCVIVRGSSGRMRLTRSRTSCVATSAFFSSLKPTTTCDTPSDEIDVSVSMPLMVLTASSIWSVTSLSTCSGAAPGSRVVTTIVGKSTLGNWSIPSCANEKTPTTVSERIRTDAKTGRRTQSAASHCMTVSYFAAAMRTPSASCATLLVATISPRARPLVISTRSPTVWPVVTIRSSTVPPLDTT